ncbi:hypothetical protein ACKI10_43295 [Streptomyces galilaeus]|uniref:PASTA domain-containing protein n=1 Tax=Streptomyces galilaeus TaxID=33899 RepID=A0ABW9IYF8_STRGJ
MAQHPRRRRELTMADTTFVLPPLPQAISRDQARAALDLLGLPVSIREVTLGVYGATVTLLAKDADGRPLQVGDDAAYITVSLPYDDSHAEPPLSSAQRYIGQSEWCCHQAFPSQGKQHDAGCARGQ